MGALVFVLKNSLAKYSQIQYLTTEKVLFILGLTILYLCAGGTINSFLRSVWEVWVTVQFKSQFLTSRV